jgi:phage tail-like protein
MATTTRRDPLPAFCFCVQFVDLKNIPEGFFKSVSGLRSETEVIPVRAGGANDTTFNLVGGVKWGPIVLKQGFTKGSGLLAWRETWLTPGPMIRSSGIIIQLDTALQSQAAWQFSNGWPSKWELSEFDAAKNELSIETLEISHDGLKSCPPPEMKVAKK